MLKSDAGLFRDLGFLGFWAWDFRTGDVEASSDLCNLFGIETVAGTPGCRIEQFELRVHPDDLEWLKHARRDSVGESGHGVVEYRVFDKAGRIHWVMCRGFYLFDDNGMLTTGRGLMLDVTAFRADGNASRSAPAPLANPLGVVTDSVLRAYDAAKQMTQPDLVSQIEQVLERVGRLLAQEIDRKMPTTTH